MSVSLKQVSILELRELLTKLENGQYPIVAGSDRDILIMSLGVALSVRQNFYVDHHLPEPHVVRKRLA